MSTAALIGLLYLLVLIGVVAAAMWALVTLSRVRTTLDAVRAQLDRVERSLAQR